MPGSAATSAAAPAVSAEWQPAWRDVALWSALVAVTGLGLGLRWHGLADKSLWLDESFTVWMTEQSWGDFWRYSSDLDLHPPLYYVLLRGWTALAQDGEIALRLPSVVFSAATVPVLWAIGRRIGGWPLGLLAALLLALSPLHIEYAQEARMYPLSALLATTAVLCAVALLVDERAPGAPPPLLRRVRTPWWAGFVLCTALLLYSHSVTVLFALAIGVFVLAVRLTRLGGPGARARADEIGLGLAAALALWLPWLPSFVGQAAKVVPEYWIDPPTVLGVVRHWRDIVGRSYQEPAPVLVALVLVLLALAGVGVWWMRRRPTSALLLVLVLVVPVVAELLVSIGRPIFYTRTIQWSAPAVYLLLAAGVLALRYRAAVVAVAAALLLYVGGRLPNYYQWHGQEDWRGVAALIATRAQPGDLVLASPGWTHLAFHYYYKRRSGPPAIRAYGVPVTLFERSELEPKIHAEDLPRLGALAAGAPRVWLLYSHYDYSDEKKIVRDHLRTTMRQSSERKFENVCVYLFESGAAVDRNSQADLPPEEC